MGDRRRWARLLEQQTSSTVFCLPTKENKCPFSVSVCSKKGKFAGPLPVCRKQTKIAVN
jgi:hypothetical protein